MPALLSLLFSRAGLVGMTLVGLLVLFGGQELRLKLAQHGEATAKAELAAFRASLKTSEDLRAAEYAKAAAAVSDAERACGERVAAALKSGSAIRTIVEKPSALDPKTHCPVRQLIGVTELRLALQP